MLGTIVFQDVVGKRAKMSVRDVTDMTALNTLATFLAGKSNCKVVLLSVADKSSVELGATADATYKSVNHKALITMEDMSTGLSSTRELPAPLEALFSHVERTGLVMLQAEGEAIATAFSTATGKTYRFIKGKFGDAPSESQI